jgi:hypothetical protein
MTSTLAPSNMLQDRVKGWRRRGFVRTAAAVAAVAVAATVLATTRVPGQAGTSADGQTQLNEPREESGLMEISTYSPAARAAIWTVLRGGVCRTAFSRRLVITWSTSV